MPHHESWRGEWGFPETPLHSYYKAHLMAQRSSEDFCPLEQLCGRLNNGSQNVRVLIPEPVNMLPSVEKETLQMGLSYRS